MKRFMCALLAVILMAACFAPIAAADGSGAPSREDIRGHGDIAVPKNDSWLASYETRYVRASGGVAAFLFKAPYIKEKLHFDDVLEGKELTALAKENDFYLVKVEDGRIGWICAGQTAEDNDLLESVPEMTDGSWVLERGSGEKNSFAVKFGEGRMAELRRASDGGRRLSGWILSGRRVLIDEIYLIWDGEQFVSRDEYETPEGKIRFTLRPDADGLYDSLVK